jgi:hypothetical protein
MKTMTINGVTDNFMSAAEVTRAYPVLSYTHLRLCREYEMGPSYISVGSRTYYSVSSVEKYLSDRLSTSAAMDEEMEVVYPAAEISNIVATMTHNGEEVELDEQSQSLLDAAANILGTFEFQVNDEEE